MQIDPDETLSMARSLTPQQKHLLERVATESTNLSERLLAILMLMVNTLNVPEAA